MADLYINVGEVARLVGISPATLRAWDRHGLVSPDRSAAGYRRYTLTDVERLRRVRRLREVDRLDFAAIRAALGTGNGSTDGAGAMAAGADATGIGATGVDGAGADPPDLAEAGDGDRPPVPDWIERLGELRQRHGLSLRGAGERTGLSPSFISGIERGLANPSVSALQKLTTAYGTSIVDLMGTGPGGRPGRSLVRVADRQRYDATAGVTMEQLNFGDHVMELHLFTVEPGAGTGGPYQHEGEEFIFLLEGSLEVRLDAVERYLLAPGDVLYFESMRPHEWTNTGSVPAKFFGVNTPRTF